MAVQIARLVAVLALLGVAAAVATPKGRLPLALRGVAKVLGRDGAVGTAGTAGAVSGRKRLLALVLVLAAVILALI